MSDFYIYYPLWGLGWASYSATAQNPKVGASPELKIHQESIKNQSKIHQKPIKNPPKIDPRSLLRPPKASWQILAILKTSFKASWERLKRLLGHIEGLWGTSRGPTCPSIAPSWSPKENQNRSKNEAKIYQFFASIFNDILVPTWSQLGFPNPPKSKKNRSQDAFTY